MSSTAPAPDRLAIEALSVHQETLRRWERSGFADALRLTGGVRPLQEEDTVRLADKIYGRSKGALDASLAAALAYEARTQVFDASIAAVAKATGAARSRESAVPRRGRRP